MSTENLTSIPRASTHARGRALIRSVLRNPLAVISVAWLLVLLVGCIAAPVFAPADPLAQNLSDVLGLPSSQHLLGTDGLGRDVLSRILYGGGGALLGALEAVAVALLIGVPLGVVAGYVGGWFDSVANRFADLVFSLPAIVVLLALAAVLGTSTGVSMATFGVLVAPVFLRLARGSTLAVRNELYVDAARVSGISRTSIVFGHVLPNVVGPLIVQGSLTFAAALLVQAGLGFLGLGPRPPAPTWGGMIADASTYIYQQPWLMVPPGLVLVFTVLAVNVIGDALRDGDAEAQKPSFLKTAANTAPPQQLATTSPSADSVLQVRNLTVTFATSPSEMNVVRDISFFLNRGETVGLVGESGSGKTMTALAIMGLLPFPGRISAGGIVFDGQDLVAADEKQLASVRGRRIGMISQEPMIALDPSFSIASQLVAPLRRHRGLTRKIAEAEAAKLLAQVGIRNVDAVLKSFPHQLSGGMAQRVAIAIALTGSPDVLVADEPTTALDVTVQAEILDLLRSLQNEMGMAIILVTHDLGVVADACDRAVVMKQGEIVESVSVEDLFARPQHPYTRELIAATPSLVQIGANRG
jgi:peptide/nickel transport system permease protein